jgi:putative membrane protein
MRCSVLAGIIALASPLGAVAQVVTPVPAAADYVTKAAQSDQFEIQTGKLALAQAMNPDVRAFGGMMVTDHAKSTALVVAAAKNRKLSAAPPPPLNPDQQAMLTELQGLKGDAFDKDYIAQQLTAHQQALDLQTRYANGGDNSNLRAAARQIIPVVQMHLGMLQKMHQQ